MAQAYTAPNWSTGEGISPSNLQSISNVLENIVQGTDKAIHNFSINGQNATVTFVDGSIETFAITGTKGIVEVTKSTSGNTDTYTIHFTDGTTYSFEVTNGGGGGNADKVELTKAEYDALPDSKLTDGKMYFINDWTQGGSESGVVYDGNERVIGTWFGKPLYRKCYDMGLLQSSATIEKPLNISDGLNICNLHGIVISTINNMQSRPLPMVGGTDGTNDIRLDTNGTNIRCITYGNWNNYKAIVIIEYTKTTD